MGGIRTGIELNDQVSDVLYGIVESVNYAINGFAEMQQVLNTNMDVSAFEDTRREINEISSAIEGIQSEMQVDVQPVVTEQPQIEVPDGVQVDVQPIVTEQPVVDVPENIEVPVTPVVTEQPVIDVPENLEIGVQADGSGVDELNARIEQTQELLSRVSNIQEMINTNSQKVEVLPEETGQRISAVRTSIEQMQQALNMIQENPFDFNSEAVEMQIVSLNNRLRETLQDQLQINDALSHMNVEVENPPPVEVPVEIPQPDPVTVPVEWQTDNMEVFTNTGVDRFRQEIASANSMLEQLGSTQDEIARQAWNTNIIPPQAAQNLNSLAVRIDMIRDRINQVSSNPMNVGTDEANAGLEELRSQLATALEAQNELNAAVQNMDVEGANAAYLNLSRTVANTERYIRDNIDEQGQFNNAIYEGVQATTHLKSMIASAVGAFAGIAGIRKAVGWIQETTNAFNVQYNSEMQLLSVLANMLDADYVLQFEVDVNADTTNAISEINAIQNQVGEINIPVTAESKALTTAFDQIKDKASEIQSMGIYGDESMIAAAGEFATYFTDVNAIMTMMDTLSNYAMGMSGGGELDTTAMVDYATNLGKIMTGSYDAMTKKGFEFSDAQKAVIEGIATPTEYLAVLGEGWENMTTDMRAAATISQVIDESWAGLYQNMSNAPQGKIIQLTNAWGDMKEMVGEQLYPYVIRFVDALNNNWGIITVGINKITEALQIMMVVFSWILDMVMQVGQLVADNWSWISPIVYGVIAALAVYAAYLGIVKAAELAELAVKGALAVAEFIHVAALAAQTGATISATAAQMGLNGAMYACPIVWIIMLIIALIAIIYAVASAIAKMTGIANSGFGVITGGINVVIQFFKNLGLEVANIALGIGNAIAALGSNMMTAFHNAISSIQAWFYDLLATGLTVIEGICEALNKLPFVEFDYSGITSAADDYAAKASEAANNKAEYKSISDAFNEGFSTFDTFQSGWVSDAFNSGAAWGDGVAEGISEALDGFMDGLAVDIPNPDDYTSGFASTIADSLGNIESDTGNISDSLDITSEDLKYLRDIAEQETINRFTTAEIKIDQSGMTNNINNGMDLDGVVDGLTDAVNEAVDIMTEGVHE